MAILELKKKKKRICRYVKKPLSFLYYDKRWDCFVYDSGEGVLSDRLCLLKQEPDITRPKVQFCNVAFFPYIFQRADN